MAQNLEMPHEQAAYKSVTSVNISGLPEIERNFSVVCEDLVIMRYGGMVGGVA